MALPKASLSSATALALFTTSVSAATLTVRFDNPIFGLTAPGPKSDQVQIWYPTSPTTTASLSVSAGRFTGVATDADGFEPDSLIDLDAGDPIRFAMYCYDLGQTIGAGNLVTYTLDLDGESQRTRAFIGAVNAVLNEGQPEPDEHAWLRPGNALAAAAIQIGIWESLYDDHDVWSVADKNGQQNNPERGRFYARNLDATTTEYLGSFFTRLNGAGDRPGFEPAAAESVIVLRSATRQDMITGDPPAAPVSAPGTVALLGAAGVLGLALRRSARRRDGPADAS